MWQLYGWKCIQKTYPIKQQIKNNKHLIVIWLKKKMATVYIFKHPYSWHPVFEKMPHFDLLSSVCDFYWWPAHFSQEILEKKMFSLAGIQPESLENGILLTVMFLIAKWWSRPDQMVISPSKGGCRFDIG